MRKRIAVPVILIIWLFIGAFAAAQRGYFSSDDQNCNTIGSTLVTILAGPLNYVGVDPEIDCPDVPEPSDS